MNQPKYILFLALSAVSKPDYTYTLYREPTFVVGKNVILRKGLMGDEDIPDKLLGSWWYP